MKEIVIISGKGGTGKTSVCASFATLTAQSFNTVFSDCDVDASDLHLIFSPETTRTETFISGHSAAIDQKTCTACGFCETLCRFDAIIHADHNRYMIEQSSCEGCGVCVKFCPAHAISFNDRICGEWHVSHTRFGTLVHAALNANAENSGKLVTIVRKEARRIAQDTHADLIITDGPPGTGCPVIATVTGADAVIAVAEPTLSGRHDLERVMNLAKHFRVPLYVCVNKWDINPELCMEIEKSCVSSNAVFLGKISYSEAVTAAQIQGKSLIEYNSRDDAAKELQHVWENLITEMNKRTAIQP